MHSAELSWVLHRAYASPDSSHSPPPDSSDAITLARKLDVLGRIASRIPGSRLLLDLGTTGLQAALADRSAAARQALRILRSSDRVSQVAARNGIPIVFLKGAALHLSNRTGVASRPASDVDVLVPRQLALAFHRTLMTSGFSPLGPSRSEHHLQPLAEGRDPPVEIHLEIPGCTVPDIAGSVVLEDLARHGLLERIPSLPGDSFVPAASFLAAHAIVHGLVDHGFGADRYPPMRMLGDVADCRDSFMKISQFVGNSVSRGEIIAVIELVEFLVSGRQPPTSSATGRLLAHVVSGSIDTDYRNALRLRQMLHLLRTGSLSTIRTKTEGRFPGLYPLPGIPGIRNAVMQLWQLLLAELRVRQRQLPG